MISELWFHIMKSDIIITFARCGKYLLHKLYLHLELYIYTPMHAKHNDDTGLVYPVFDTVNEVCERVQIPHFALFYA
jgi:hypothetical protein